VAALRLLLHENDRVVDAALHHAMTVANDTAHGRLSVMAGLLADARRRAPALRAVAAAGAALTYSPLDLADVQSWASAFDHAARIDQSAATALYALGDPRRLADATREVVAYLDAEALIHEDARVLDIGTGGGRILDALAPWIGYGVGVDISEKMLAAAQSRGNLSYLRTDGRDLRAFRDRAFDLVLAVDSFPYLAAAGVEAAHVAEAARVLDAGGAFVVMNYSKGADRAGDRARFAARCAESGLTPVTLGVQPFTLWDGAVFVARRA